MRKLKNICVILLCIWTASLANARHWTDSTGTFQVDAELVLVKGGKVYLEKRDGNVIGVPLERLSQKDLQHLVTLEEYRDYFKANPVPGLVKEAKGSASAARPSPKSAIIQVDDESKAGEVRRFGDLGWGVTALAFSPDGRFLAVGKMDEMIMVFDVDKSQRVAVLEKQRGLGQVTSLAFIDDCRCHLKLALIMKSVLPVIFQDDSVPSPRSIPLNGQDTHDRYYEDRYCQTDRDVDSASRIVMHEFSRVGNGSSKKPGTHNSESQGTTAWKR